MVYVLLQEVKAKVCILKSTIFAKLKPTGPLQTMVGGLSEEDIPRMVSLAMLAIVISVARIWSPDKNNIVVLEVKYISAFCTYSESVVQLVEF